MLHIVTKADAFMQSGISCLDYIDQNDVILLSQDAVYAANPKHALYPRLMDLAVKICVLEEDLSARGIASNSLTNCKVVSFDGFVELTELHSSTLTWS